MNVQLADIQPAYAGDLEALRNALGEYAKDTKLNLSSVLREGPESGLNMKQIAGIALSSAYATKEPELIHALTGEFSELFTAEEIAAIKGAAVIMAMNNIYYRFVHLSSDKDYGKMPAGLRMNIIGNPGIEKIDFELYSLAVSALNGCGMCMDAHAAQLEKVGVSKSGVQHTIKIASVVNAAAQALLIGKTER